MKRRYDVVVVGGANLDYLVVADQLPRPGETVQAGEFQEAAGGKGANQAVQAARLGARVAFVARVGGDDRGELVLRSLEKERIDLGRVIIDREKRTGIALVMVGAKGEKQIAADLGANRALTSSDVENARELIEQTSVVLLQLEIPIEAAKRAIFLGRQAGAEIILDPAPPSPPARELVGSVDLIRPNASEAQVLTGIEAHDRRSAKKAAQALLKSGAGAACVQAGDEGDLLVRPNAEDLFLPRIQVKSVDATGAGDAFLGTLAALRASGASLDEAARHASAAAALATTRVGAQAGLATKDQISELLARQTMKGDFP